MAAKPQLSATFGGLNEWHGWYQIDIPASTQQNLVSDGTGTAHGAITITIPENGLVREAGEVDWSGVRPAYSPSGTPDCGQRMEDGVDTIDDTQDSLEIPFHLNIHLGLDNEDGLPDGSYSLDTADAQEGYIEWWFVMYNVSYTQPDPFWCPNHTGVEDKAALTLYPPDAFPAGTVGENPTRLCAQEPPVDPGCQPAADVVVLVDSNLTYFPAVATWDLRRTGVLPEEPEPGVCADGADNDSDGLADYPADPGCSSVDDGSELGTAICDNGIDDDQDGKTDWKADPNCTGPTGGNENSDCFKSEGTRASQSLHLDGRIVLGGLRDAHLFRFEPFLIYCFGAGTPEFLHVSTLGTIDYGVTTLALSSLGFDFTYDSESATFNGSHAAITGKFGMHVNWLSLLGRFGVSKVFNKVFAKKFEVQLEGLLKNSKYYSKEVQGYLDRTVFKATARMRGHLAQFFDDLRDRLRDRLPSALEGLISVVDDLERFVLSRVNPKLDAVDRNFGVAISDRHLKKASASQVAGIFSRALTRYTVAVLPTGFSNFPIWTPTVYADVLPSGNLNLNIGDSFRNPLITPSSVVDQRQLLFVP